MTRVIIGDLLTGRNIVDVPFLSYSWSRRRNRPETLSCVVTLTDPDIRDLGLRNAATGGKVFLAIVEEFAGGEWFAGAGQMNKPSYDSNSGTLTLTAAGIWAYLYKRMILPPSALTLDVEDFLIPDPSDATKTIPNPAAGTYLSGWSHGTLIKKWIEQALAWPNGDVPIILPADVVGTHERNIQGTDFKPVGEAITDRTRIEGGPDVEFPARYQADRKGVEWPLRVGTDDQPALRSASVHRWDLSVDQTSTRRLKVTPDSEMLGSLSWAAGGRATDEAIVERAYDSALLDAGFPLQEIVDTTHTDVSLRPTLLRHAVDNLTRGQGETEVWSFEVRKDASPFLGEYSVGDYVDLIVKDDLFIPDSPPGVPYRREIAALSGSQGDWVKITTAEVVG